MATFLWEGCRGNLKWVETIIHKDLNLLFFKCFRTLCFLYNGVKIKCSTTSKRFSQPLRASVSCFYFLFQHSVPKSINSAPSQSFSSIVGTGKAHQINMSVCSKQKSLKKHTARDVSCSAALKTRVSAHRKRRPVCRKMVYWSAACRFAFWARFGVWLSPFYCLCFVDTERGRCSSLIAVQAMHYYYADWDIAQSLCVEQDKFIIYGGKLGRSAPQRESWIKCFN
jgi:hypothetical protein